MNTPRGSILVLLVAIWTTLPALAGICPKQIPPCCRGMREMCCMSSNTSAANLCCPLQMQEATASPAAIANVTDNATHAMSPTMVAFRPMQLVPPVVSTTAEMAPSPPIPAGRNLSVLRI